MTRLKKNKTIQKNSKNSKNIKKNSKKPEIGTWH